VQELARSLFEPTEVAEYFVCGPGDMIDQVTGALKALNVSGEQIHGEHFTVSADAAGDAHGVCATGGAAGGSTAGASQAGAIGDVPAADGPGADGPGAKGGVRLCYGSADVTVLIDGRRRSFMMRTDEGTVLDAAMRAGLDLPYSCRAGVCSTCRTKVVSGEVEMDQNYALEEWELQQGYVLACQSRVKTPTLELDYDEK
jgi:ring-1,2-phenylacetyl-CoA epoxidase subunit PaaE